MPDHMDDVLTDRERIDWLCSHPANIKWNHERGWVVSFGFPFGQATGRTLRDALDNAMRETRKLGPPATT